MSDSPPTIGVLVVQGDFREHLAALARLETPAVPVRRVAELDRCDALIVPGGESTTMGKLLVAFDLFDPIRRRIDAGMPVFGTCAGMIMLASDLLDATPGQPTFGALDIVVRRNAFGRQVDSFEGSIDFAGLDDPVHGVFIRAPWVETAGPDVEVLASVDVAGTTRIVGVRQGSSMATSFHPEVGDDDRIHAMFVDLVRQSTGRD